MNRRSISLTTVVIGIIVVVISLTLTIVGTFAYRSYSAQKWNEFNEAVDLEAERLSIALAPAVWNLEYPQTRKLMESLLKDRRYQGIVVDLVSSKLALIRGPKGISDESTALPQVVPERIRHRRIMFAGEDIGEVTVFANSSVLEMELKQALFFFVGLALLLECLLTIALYLSLKHLLLEPLRRVERFATNVAAGNNTDAAYDELSLFGELDRLAKAIDALLRQLQQRNAELLKSSENFKKVIRLLPLPVVLFDDAGKHLYVNESFVRTFGYTLEDVPDSETWFAQAYPDPNYRNEVIATWAAEMTQSLEKLSPIRSLPYRVRCKNGAIKNVEIGGMTSDNINIALFIDVTDRTLAEAELSRHREHLEELVESRTSALMATNQRLEETQFAMDHAGIGIAWINPEDGHFLYVNDQACKLLGRPRDVLLRGHVTEVSDEFTRERSQALAKDIIALGHSRLETSVAFEDGCRLPIEVSLYFQPPTAEQTAGRYCAFVMDISQRKAAEASLIEAKHAAELAAKTRSQFLANMSHEIRTPMNAIIGMSELVMQGELEPRQRNFIGKVHHSARALLGIINDILDFSKVEAGKIEIEHIPFKLDDVFEQLATLLMHEATRKELELVFDLPTNLPDQLVGDPLRLGQILTNLVGNAIKFTERGSVVLRCDVATEPAAARYRINLSVRDTGIGMSSDQISALFSPFHQADTTISRRYGGTGLGLTISKRLTELMGGQITVSSNPGKGSTFTLSIPFAASDVLAPPSPGIPSSLITKTALVVHPQPLTGKYLCRLLAGWGMETLSVPTAAEALQAYAKDASVRLVLAAATLPDQTGETLVDALIGHSNRTPPRCILIAHADEFERTHLKTELMIGASVICAPVLPRTLLNALYEANSDTHSLPQAPQSLTRLDGVSILLVEDNELNQELASEILKSRGAAVSLAANGQEALDCLARHAFDCVLMDVQMPVMDGLTATRHIREDARWKTLPIIAMTAGLLPEEREKIHLAGMDAYIGKPIDTDALLNTILRLTTAVPGARTSDRQRDDLEVKRRVDDASPAFDAALGLRIANGRQSTFVRLLDLLLASTDAKVAQLANLMSVESREELSRLAHELKGSCASVGAVAMSNAMSDIENDLRTSEAQEILERHITAVPRLWDDTKSAIHHFLGLPSTSTASDEHNPALLQALASLRRQLQADDVEAIVQANQLRQFVVPYAHRAAFNRLLRQVRAYQFEQAISELDALRDNLKTTVHPSE